MASDYFAVLLCHLYVWFLLLLISNPLIFKSAFNPPLYVLRETWYFYFFSNFIFDFDFDFVSRILVILKYSFDFFIYYWILLYFCFAQLWTCIVMLFFKIQKHRQQLASLFYTYYLELSLRIGSYIIFNSWYVNFFLNIIHLIYKMDDRFCNDSLLSPLTRFFHINILHSIGDFILNGWGFSIHLIPTLMLCSWRMYFIFNCYKIIYLKQFEVFLYFVLRFIFKSKSKYTLFLKIRFQNHDYFKKFKH